MKDKLGNKIVKGSMLQWRMSEEDFKRMRGEIYAVASDVSEPMLEGNDQPPTLAITIIIPISGVTKGKEAQLSDFVCVQNPQQEAMLSGMLKN